jgi:hypothetical protein
LPQGTQLSLLDENKFLVLRPPRRADWQAGPPGESFVVQGWMSLSATANDSTQRPGSLWRQVARLVELMRWLTKVALGARGDLLLLLPSASRRS